MGVIGLQVKSPEPGSWERPAGCAGPCPQTGAGACCSPRRQRKLEAVLEGLVCLSHLVFERGERGTYCASTCSFRLIKPELPHRPVPSCSSGRAAGLPPSRPAGGPLDSRGPLPSEAMLGAAAQLLPSNPCEMGRWQVLVFCAESVPEMQRLCSGRPTPTRAGGCT